MHCASLEYLLRGLVDSGSMVVWLLVWPSVLWERVYDGLLAVLPHQVARSC